MICPRCKYPTNLILVREGGDCCHACIDPKLSRGANLRNLAAKYHEHAMYAEARQAVEEAIIADVLDKKIGEFAKFAADEALKLLLKEQEYAQPE